MRPDIVLIHGMWCRGDHLESVAQPLREAGYRCHLLTLPFHRDPDEATDPGLGTASLLDYADFCQGAIDQLKLSTPPVIIGHSMGGLIAQMLAARMAVSAAVLLTPAAPAGVFGVNRRTLAVFWRKLLTWGFWRKPHRLTAEQARRYALNGLPSSQQDTVIPTLVDESGRALFELAAWPVDTRRAAVVDPARVTCPLYVVAAEDDWLTPPSVVRRVASRYSQSELRVDPGRGHWVIDDSSTPAMMADIIDWLDRTLSGRST